MATQAMNPGNLYDPTPRTLTGELITWAPLLAFPLGLLLGAFGLWTQPPELAVSKAPSLELHASK